MATERFAGCETDVSKSRMAIAGVHIFEELLDMICPAIILFVV